MGVLHHPFPCAGTPCRVRLRPTSCGGCRMGRPGERTYGQVAAGRRCEMVQKILVGTDTSAPAELAVEAAADLATSHDAELVVLYVRPRLDVRKVFDPGKLRRAASCPGSGGERSS